MARSSYVANIEMAQTHTHMLAVVIPLQHMDHPREQMMTILIQRNFWLKMILPSGMGAINFKLK